MKSSGNRVILRWREPKYFLTYAKKHLTWKGWLRAYTPLFTKMTLFIVGLWVFIRLIRKDGEIISWLAVSLAMATGLIVCLLTWLLSFAPIEILFREKDIVKRTAEGTVRLSYKEMQGCVVKEVYLDDRSIHILDIRMNDGNQWAFEIAPEISWQTIKELLEEKGVGVRLTSV